MKPTAQLGLAFLLLIIVLAIGMRPVNTVASIQASGAGATIRGDVTLASGDAIEVSQDASTDTVTFNLDQDCSDDQILKWDSASTDWVCEVDVGGAGSGDIDAVGDVASGAAFTADGGGNTLYFEGSTPDDYEILLTGADATADRTLTLPQVTGTLVTTGDTGTVTNTMLAGSIDISDKTNLAVSAPVTLTGDTVGLDENAGTDVTADLEEEAHVTEHQENGADELLGETLGTACTDGQFVEANATGGLDCHTVVAADISDQHASTDITADLEEEAHVTEHQENGADELTGETLGTACTDGQFLEANATGGLDCHTVAAADISDQHASTDITADLEEEAHKSEHASGGGDALFIYREGVWQQANDVSTTMDIEDIRLYARGSGTIVDAMCSVNTAPTTDSVIVDFNKNGTTIFTTQANRVTIAAAGYYDVSGAPDVTTYSANDYFDIDIDETDTGNTAADLSCQLRVKEAVVE